MEQFHHRKLPDYSTLLSGRLPPNDIGFQSERLQIWYNNNATTTWRDPADPCHDRVILTPHSAFYSEEGLRDIRVKAATACKRALLGQPLRNVVN